MSYDENPFEASGVGGAKRASLGGGRTVTVRRLDVLSVAKLQAAIMLVIGLIFGAFGALFGAVGFLGFMASGDNAANAGAAAGGFVGIVVGIALITLLYAVIGFIGGALGALVYNTAAGMFGGIRMVLDDD